jgi:lipoyl(octanoyl) transferase
VIQYLYLGRVDYGVALRLQQELVALRTAGRVGNVLVLLEHPPVLTLGRNARRANVLASDELLAARGVTLYEINRGGDVTYHGPGQLVGYPIFDLRSLRNAKGARLGPVDFVRLMEEALIRLCGEFGVATGRICGLTGVWVGGLSPSPADDRLLDESPAGAAKNAAMGERKIAAIGIHVARGVTSHGFAFNTTTNLDDFRLIVPCGITDRSVTSLAREIAAPPPSLQDLAHRVAGQFGAVFGEPVEALENLAALRAQAENAPAKGPENPTRGDASSANPAPEFPAQGLPEHEFPANDAPLQIPPDIERLRRTKERPIPA